MHSCDALIVCCIDFRFQKFIRDFTDSKLVGKKFDLVGYAGGVKDLETIIKQLEISVRLHNIKQVVLVNHEECGAYGTESTPERHAFDLRKAKDEILAKDTGLIVDCYYLHLDGTFEKIA